MIQTNLATVIGSMEAIKKLLDNPIKGKTAYKIAKLVKKMEEEYALFNESRLKLLNKYAVKDEGGQPVVENGNYKVLPESIANFNQEIAELLDAEVSFDLEPISLEEIGDIEFTPAEMLMIDSFIKE